MKLWWQKKPKADARADASELNSGLFAESSGGESLYVDADEHRVSDQKRVRVPTTVIRLGGEAIAVGLNWSSANNDNDARKLAEPNQGFITSPGYSGDVNVGTGTSEAIGTLAGGLMVGSLYPFALVAQRIPGTNKVWMCAISDGLPLPGFDRVLTEEEAHNDYTSFSRYATGEAKIIGDLLPSSRFKSLEELVQEYRNSGKKRELFRLQKNGTNYKRVLMLSLVLMIVAGTVVSGFVYWEHLRDQRKRELALKQLMQTKQQQDAERARIRGLVDNFNTNVANQRATFGISGVADKQWAECEQVRLALPLVLRGYKPLKITCDFTTHKASVEWGPVNTLTRVSDRVHLPGIVDELSTLNPAKSEFPLAKVEEAGVPAPKINGAEAKMTILDWTGIYLRNSRFNADTPVVVAPPAEIASEPGVVPVNLGVKATFEINANTAREKLVLPETALMLTDKPLQFTEITWVMPTKASNFRATGVLYIAAGN